MQERVDKSSNSSHGIKIRIADILLLQLGFVISFVSYNHVGLTGAGVLCFFGSFLSLFNGHAWLDNQFPLGERGLLYESLFRSFGFMIGAAFGGIIGFAIGLCLILNGLITLSTGFDVVILSCLLSGCVAGSIKEFGGRVRRLTSILYMLILIR